MGLPEGPPPIMVLVHHYSKVLSNGGSALRRFPDIVAATEKIHNFDIFDSSPLESARMYVARFFPIAQHPVSFKVFCTIMSCNTDVVEENSSPSAR